MSRKRSMAEKTGDKPGEQNKLTRAFLIIAAPVLFLLILYFAGKLFLASPYATGLVSGYLSDSLQQRVNIEGIGLSGMTVSVRGIAVSNPDGFPAGAMLRARSLSFTPNLPEILTGKRSFTLLRIEGVKVDLRKNAAGEWNCGRLLRHLTRSKERPAGEVFIRRLVILDTSLRAGDFALEKLGLTVNDLSTKGLVNSKLLLTGADQKGNPFRLAAEGRFGKDPDLRFSLDAPIFVLGSLGEMVKGNTVIDMKKGTAGLSLVVRYHSGSAIAKGHAALGHVGIVTKGQTVPMRGIMDFAAVYNAARDEARLERLSLMVNDTLKIAASGTVQHVKGVGEFSARVACEKVKLEDITALLPNGNVKDMAVRGSVTCSGLRLAGSLKNGVTSGGGEFSLRDVAAVKDGRTVFEGLSSDILVSRAAHGWNLGGTLSMKQRTAMFPLENLEARFTARFSNGFSPLSVEIPALKAGMNGVPVEGELTFTPDALEPYRGTLYAKNVPLSAFKQLVDKHHIDISSGTADITIRGAGQGPASFAGELNARMSAMKGKVSGKDCSLRDGEVTSRFSRYHGGVTAKGNVRVDGGTYSTKNFSGSSSFLLADGKFVLAGGKAVLDGTNVRYADINGTLPSRETGPEGMRYPFAFVFTGLEVVHGEVRVRDVSGKVAATFTPGAEAGRLTGNATLNLPSVSLRGQSVGSLNARVVMSRDGSAVSIDGAILDGTVSSVVKLDTYFPRKRVTFTGKLQNAQAGRLSSLYSRPLPVFASGGRITVDLEGNWSEETGVRCGIKGYGNDVTLVTKSGKPFVEGAGLTLDADVAGTGFTVNEAAVTRGNGVALKIAGSMIDAAKPARKGKFSIRMDTTHVASLVPAVANILPKPMQQAYAGGNLAMGGTLAVDGGKILLDGTMKFDDVHFDFTSQRVNISGINGDLPFSLYLAGADVERPSDPLIFSKANYKVLVEALRRKAIRVANGPLLRIGKVQFGHLETGDLSLRIQSGKGLTEISSIESSLYGGKVIGKGYMVYDKGLRYDVDLLISDMSLRRFCNSYPNLKGYISGQLDGIISLYGEEGGLSNMLGFVDLWAHTGKGEKMLVSKEFLQRLAGKKLKGFFFRDDRPYDRGEISAYLQDGYLTFEHLDLSHTNLLGMNDLNVSVAPVQNRIGLKHLFDSIRQAAARGKPSAGQPPVEPPVEPDLKWLE
jgi:hypothetical protein